MSHILHILEEVGSIAGLILWILALLGVGVWWFLSGCDFSK